ncbi:16S rRNA (adenine(1518)-N(6)/adenine(1519)-N(6))-dimethyltransferase RsmA [Canibacter zhoujuaniae]|uniref:16S rRNA (adenine(1518)-N(6)/adenine(1519)-N(6))- dimethyltransferase RsmA n=1 Tax=Canibacter zhoujuaniae TaxID=2708343 RepID=UPI001AB0202C|nr:16S rRNA (adenine(1518)-N(6)/adenine(1519)-N(6))-dimethyltransferase RsmA [Canibacter zhoujuaniae]
MSGESSQGLLSPALVRELASQFGVTPTKKLGQNFVHDANTVRKIVRIAGVKAHDTVLEVGPGLGSLTLGLTETGASVTAIELDAVLASQIENTVVRLQPEAKFRVIHDDALRVTELPEQPNILVANLPYNVSVPILMHLLETFPSIQRVLVMVQLEVGERIAAAPGSKAYGAPSAKAAWYGPWQLAGTVSRKIFWPVPGVDSVLVGFTKLAAPRGSATEKWLTFEIINAAFATRRKMLRQSLQAVRPALVSDTWAAQSDVHIPNAQATAAQFVSADAISALLEECGIDPTSRAEQLAVADFHRIAIAALHKN